MKTSHYIISLLLIILPLNYVFPQEIEAKLSGNTSGEGFSVKDNLNNTLFRITGEGNVGIGTTNPLRKMQVNGALGWGTTNAVLQTDQGASIELRGDGSPYIDFSNNLVSDYNVRLVLNRNNILEIDGNVGIGTSNANGYKLAVGGNVIAEEIVVKLKENWPDYVFNKNYEKPKLKELENYILDNGHLPKIPNSENVSKEGINIGEIQIKMLEKIEELTLYLIEQDKKLEKLENDYELLKKKFDSN
jgi:hypothetical protein